MVSIPVQIGTKYVQFVTFLLDDSNGARVKIMGHKHLNDSKRINTEIIQEWKKQASSELGNPFEMLQDIELTALLLRIILRLSSVQHDQSAKSELVVYYSMVMPKVSIVWLPRL